jgi:hypothetical protein
MSIVKATANSRWKGALLAAAAAGALLPAAAEATLTVNLQLAPGANGATAMYINPNSTADIPVYVYATVTGTGLLTSPYTPGSTAAPLTTGDFDGLQFLYYNILNSDSTGPEITGGVDTAAGFAPTLNATLGFNGINPQPNPTSSTTSLATLTGVGAQVGTVVNSAPVGTTPGISIGSLIPTTATSTAAITSALEAIPKPRSNSPVFQNYAQSATNSLGSTTYNTIGNDNYNIVINSATSVSFLVETFYFKPSASNPGAKTTFTASVPNLTAAGVPASNYFQDNTTLNPGGQPQSTLSAAAASGTQVVLTQTLPGDLNDDGVVNILDFNILAAHFGQTVPSGTDGDITGASGSPDGVVNILDFNLLASEFGKSVSAGLTPSSELSPLAAFAAAEDDTAAYDAAVGIAPTSVVPESASLGLLAVGLGLLGARRRRV